VCRANVEPLEEAGLEALAKAPGAGVCSQRMRNPNRRQVPTDHHTPVRRREGNSLHVARFANGYHAVLCPEG
jgi:hypothetical protein